MSNMDTNFDLQEYLTNGVEGVIAVSDETFSAMKAYCAGNRQMSV